jgi:hypothetical protein
VGEAACEAAGVGFTRKQLEEARWKLENTEKILET